jgi:hypothetical protein
MVSRHRDSPDTRPPKIFERKDEQARDPAQLIQTKMDTGGSEQVD